MAAIRCLRWPRPRGVASLVFGLVLFLCASLFWTTVTLYAQVLTTRTGVINAVTTALQEAVPASYVSETPVTTGHPEPGNLVLDPATFNAAVDRTLAAAWPDAILTPCGTTPTTPPGGPVCTVGTSTLITLSPAVATPLHIVGPLVLTNVQVVLGPPLRVTHWGHSDPVSGPAVAADVGVPIDLTLGSAIQWDTWIRIAVTAPIIADTGNTPGSSPYRRYHIPRRLRF